MRTRRLAAALAATLGSAALPGPTCPALAAIDMAVTERGSPRLSGGPDDVVSHGLETVLLEFNNDLDPSGPGGGPSLVDIALGLEQDNFRYAIGYLVRGRNGTIYTYDRLVAREVLQLLGFGRSGSSPDPAIPTPGPSQTVLRYGGGLPSIATTANPPTIVPEPASLGMTALAVWIARRKPRSSLAA